MRPAPAILTDDEQGQLLLAARLALDARVRRLPAPEAPCGGACDACRDVFVTLHSRCQLRGCLGRVDADAPLGASVVALAAALADSDPRFPPVSGAELDAILIEISVLTPMREASADGVEVGRHGVLVTSGACRGLLLPQVAAGLGWDARTLIEQACVKAGLPREAWRSGARLFTFEAVVFDEPSAIGL